MWSDGDWRTLAPTWHSVAHRRSAVAAPHYAGGNTAMLGPSHALSGAAAWLVGSFVEAQLRALSPDARSRSPSAPRCAPVARSCPTWTCPAGSRHDQGGATVAHTFGVVSLFVVECVEKFSLGVYDLTKTRRDPRRHNGHRTFTHTRAVQRRARLRRLRGLRALRQGRRAHDAVPRRSRSRCAACFPAGRSGPAGSS